MRMVMLLTVLPLAFAAPAAGQERCAERVDSLTARIGMPSELPEPGEGENLSETLAQSGGVLAPPPAGRTPVLEPPPDVASDMPTAPPVDGGEITEEAESDIAAEATVRARVGSLLTGAREALQSGNEQACMERVNEALALLEEAQD